MRAVARRRTARGGLIAATIGLACAIALASAATVRAEEPTYGVVPQDGAVPSRAEVEEMVAGGVTSIRLLLHWPSVEPEPGEYDWGVIDAIVRETTNYGARPFFMLYGSPKWVTELDGV